MPETMGPKLQEDHIISVQQLLNDGFIGPPLKRWTKAMELLRVLQSHPYGWVFDSPVDPVELGLPDYFHVIKNPMDLGTVQKKLENGEYRKLSEVERDILLTFDNAMLYNPEGSVVYNMASELKVEVQRDFSKLMVQPASSGRRY